MDSTPDPDDTRVVPATSQPRVPTASGFRHDAARIIASIGVLAAGVGVLLIGIDELGDDRGDGPRRAMRGGGEVVRGERRRELREQRAERRREFSDEQPRADSPRGEDGKDR